MSYLIRADVVNSCFIKIRLSVCRIAFEVCPKVIGQVAGELLEQTALALCDDVTRQLRRPVVSHNWGMLECYWVRTISSVVMWYRVEGMSTRTEF